MQLVRERSSTVISARWATVERSRPNEDNWCARADLRFENIKRRRWMIRRISPQNRRMRGNSQHNHHHCHHNHRHKRARYSSSWPSSSWFLSSVSSPFDVLFTLCSPLIPRPHEHYYRRRRRFPLALDTRHKRRSRFHSASYYFMSLASRSEIAQFKVTFNPRETITNWKGVCQISLVPRSGLDTLVTTLCQVTLTLSFQVLETDNYKGPVKLSDSVFKTSYDKAGFHVR